MFLFVCSVDRLHIQADSVRGHLAGFAPTLPLHYPGSYWTPLEGPSLNGRSRFTGVVAVASTTLR